MRLIFACLSYHYTPGETRTPKPALMVSVSVPASSSCFHLSLHLRRIQATRFSSSLCKCHLHAKRIRSSFASPFRSRWKVRASVKDPHPISEEELGKDVGLIKRDLLLHECKEIALQPQFGNMLGITFLSGLLLFQGCNAALASGDIGVAQQPMEFLGDLGDISTGFASAFLLIFFSELGDKTFFIAALLAARNSGAVVFIGTFGALAAMTIVSVVLGRAFHYIDGIIPFRLGESDFPVDDFAAVCLLVYFGVTTLLDAASGDNQKIKEEQEEAELAISNFGGNGAGIMAAASTVISTFILVFVAEWGDKSFFSTVALAAASSPLGVIGGTLAGHAVATLIAVLGGSLLGKVLSEKAISYVGGTLFLVFAAVTLVEIVT